MDALKLLEQDQSEKTSQRRLSNEKAGSGYLIREDVLGVVSQNRYKDAAELLKKYLEREFELPGFKEDVRMYVSHAIDIISAIDMAKNYPNMQSLSWAKQQEIKEKAKKHNDELSQVLDKMERVYLRHKQQDQKTTIYFIKSLWASMVLIVGAILVADLVRGQLLSQVYTVTEIFIDKLSTLISSFI